LICRGFTRHCALNSAGLPVAVDTKTVHLWKTFPS
jgi:acyl-CoA thioester hydrolase